MQTWVLSLFLLISPCLMNNSGLLTSDLWVSASPAASACSLFKTDPGFVGHEDWEMRAGEEPGFVEEKLRSSQGQVGEVQVGQVGGGCMHSRWECR